MSSRAEEANLLEQLPSMMWRSGLDAKCDYFNKSWLAFTGRALEQELGDGWMEGIHPEDRHRVVRTYLKAFDTREPFEMEYRLRHNSGEYRRILDIGRPLYDLEGNFTGYIGTCFDLTDLKQVEKAWQESQALFEGLFQYAPDAVVVVNHRGEILLVNQQTEEMFGYLRDELLGKPMEILMPEGFRQRHRGHVNHYMAQPRLRPMGAGLDLLAMRKDGTLFPVDITLGPLKTAQGNLVLATIRDITERKRVEAELRHYQDRLEERVEERTEELQKEITRRNQVEAVLQTYAAQLSRSNQDLQDFASIASHDLQEPLRKIQTFSDRLKSRFSTSLDEEGLNYLDRIQNAAARMQVMLSDLLIYSRVTAKAQPLTAVDLNQVVDEVISDLEVRIEETGGSIELHELPIVEADPLQMRLLFQNLIGNALKFHRPGTYPVVKIYAHQIPEPRENHLRHAAKEKPNASQKYAYIVVEDNGIGFDEKYLDKIFQPFQRLHSQREYEGTGIGLAICRKIVERHGGKISANSQPGQGTKFTIELPLLWRGNRTKTRSTDRGKA